VNDTVKTVLIVGGVAVGVVLLFKALSPSVPMTTTKPQSATDMISLNGLIGLGTAVAGLFGSSSGAGMPTSGAPSVGYESGESFDDFANGFFGPGATDVIGSD